MYSQIISGSLYGLTSEQVIVETDLSPGLPAFNVVGLPDTTVKESKERIRAAIVNSGYKFPAKRIIINLSPASTRKEGTHFDLPIALGVMAAVGYIAKEKVSEFAFLGIITFPFREIATTCKFKSSPFSIRSSLSCPYNCYRRHAGNLDISHIIYNFWRITDIFQ
jgi:hypothetical protein